MSDEQTPQSGSRWEPTPPEAADETASQPAPPPVPESAAATTVPAEARTPWTRRIRSNSGLVGAGVALVLVGGLGGVAIGHATAGPDRIGMVREGFQGGPGGGFPPGGDHHGFGTPPGGSDDDHAPDDGGGDDSGTGGQSGSAL
jgi:hypothetical protein